MAVDGGGIAEGYAADKAFELLRVNGFKNLILNADGDLRVGGLKNGQPWTIGIQDPIVDKDGKTFFSPGLKDRISFGP